MGRRVRLVERYLVKTMRAVPAPGLAPLTMGDWLIITSVVTLPAVAIVALSILAHLS